MAPGFGGAWRVECPPGLPGCFLGPFTNLSILNIVGLLLGVGFVAVQVCYTGTILNASGGLPQHL